MTKFGLEVQFDPLDRLDHQKFEISKIQDGGSRHLKKRKLTYLRHGLNDFNKIWHSKVVRPF